MLVAIIFMMVLPSCAFADSASDYSKHHEKDLLKDAASDADSQNSAMWGDVVLPVQVCAPRVSRTIVSFEPCATDERDQIFLCARCGYRDRDANG